MTAHIKFTPMWSHQAEELGYMLNTSADSCILPSTLNRQRKINSKILK